MLFKVPVMFLGKRLSKGLWASGPGWVLCCVHVKCRINGNSTVEIKAEDCKPKLTCNIVDIQAAVLWAVFVRSLTLVKAIQGWIHGQELQSSIFNSDRGLWPWAINPENIKINLNIETRDQKNNGNWGVQLKLHFAFSYTNRCTYNWI